MTVNLEPLLTGGVQLIGLLCFVLWRDWLRFSAFDRTVGGY